MRRLLLTTACVLACAPPAHAATGSVGYDVEPDYVDPALTYTLIGWSVLWRTHIGLLTYDDENRLIPGAAEALPEVSPDGRTYTLRLREGLRYSNGRRVRARDFEHAIKRVITLESGGAPFYYASIRGAQRYLRRGRARGDISGIASDEASRTIRITLVEPDGQFANVLAMPFAGLVPSSTPFEILSRRPPPGVGPLRIVRSTRRGMTLTRTPGFALPGVPQATLDRITMRYGVRRARTTDAYVDPPVRLRSGDGYRERTAMATHYFFLNHRVPPFDNVDVRRAAASALDKYALARRFGMQPACQILPPDMPGHRPRGPCPYQGIDTPPDLEGPRAMVREAGAEGARVAVYGIAEPDSRRQAAAFARTLDAIGMRARTIIIPGDVFFTAIGSQRTRAQAGVSNWFADYPHPWNFLWLFSGNTIQRTNNQNFGNVDDPGLTATIDRVFAQPADVAAEEATAADYRIIDEAHAIPWGHSPHATLFSGRVPPECRFQHPLYGTDLVRLCVR